MTLPVFLAVLAAAALHAGWNAVLKIRIEPFLAMVLINGAGAVIGCVAVCFTGWPIAAAWPMLIASAVIHLGYYLFLTAAYNRADMGFVYPIARGSAPLMTALGSLLVLREPLPLQGYGGVLVLGCGIATMALSGRKRAVAPQALAYAGLTAIMVCLYTLTDGTGARIAGDPHAYAAALFVVDGLGLTAIAIWKRGLAGLKPLWRFKLPGLAGGTMSLAAYWIAIWAMTVAPIALVAAVRETSVLFATLIAVVWLKEPLSPARILSAALIVAGLMLIRLA
ncbi:EamA family transporter [Alsobacter soli]|uniref:EamA family transporter n=1 Tax=Alsobacter soli TaxID=2109933 RepID=A0A2T1HPV4_9HYPH|nr:EamA family transporter [Alsobacter soli]PSC03684.1 EamA family transporter [Alsobacter soli]